MHISESKRCYNVIPSVHYFYAKTKILADFQICVSVPLKFVYLVKLQSSRSTTLSPKNLKSISNFEDWVLVAYKKSVI